LQNRRQAMKTMLVVCLMVIYFVRAAALPITGTWEGFKDGRKAVTVEVREREGIIGGAVVFYIVHDGADGKLDGSALEPMTMKGTTWDGKTLRFEAGPAKVELRLTEADRGELKVTTPEHSEIQAITRRR
jgi:hypothetical protein